MKAIELDKTYNPKDFEDRVYAAWNAEGCFDAVSPKGKKPFVMVMPPPNVTGILHMGHALNNGMPDILMRFHRMKGEPVLWLPGSDHAGIATQHVVEQKLRARGVDKRSLGRDKFIEETWNVTHEHHAVIKKQLEKLGSSCDWKRERFTLDDGLSKAVREVFVTLYERGLIYRGEYLVNWCPSCGTALSDDEVEHEDEAGAMYHIRYPLVETRNGLTHIEIATTRPETMLGDTAVAFHPADERYTALSGAMLELPLTGRRIPLIADEYVDREFGTGLVKITPAHDPNDFEVGKRHKLAVINILTPDGKLNDAVPQAYRGLSVKEARRRVLEDLEAAGFFIRKDDMRHSVGHCYRCHTVVEPYVSKQWFVKMKPMAEKALAAWRKGEVRFFPRRWENTYENWLTGIRDWCISRQLWWGHRIPVWYCEDCGQLIVSRDDPAACSNCSSKRLRQDEDVLDTWFSSWLWPFSTLGWPEKTADYAAFYPTTTLLTGFDIIFFWVARMIMAGLEFTGQVPFRDVCMTTLIRDKEGRKMSKSLGNGIDPLDIVAEYGADALKFTLAFLYTSTQDILINKDDFKLGSKFANKIWNASRYILMNLEGRDFVASPRLTDIDTWIYARLARAAGVVDEALGSYRFNDAAAAVYEYFWNDFCDWYVEATKLSTRSDDDAEKNRAVTVLLGVLAESLALAHPFLPFVTEEIYGKLPGSSGQLMLKAYPEDSPERRAPELEAQFSSLKELVSLVRALRSEFGISPEKKLRLDIRFDDGFAAADCIRRNTELIALLAHAEVPQFVPHKSAGAIALAGTGFEVYVYARDAVDIVQLAARFIRESEKETLYIEATKTKLGKEAFIQSAPPAVIEKERQKLADAEKRLAKLKKYIADIGQ